MSKEREEVRCVAKGTTLDLLIKCLRCTTLNHVRAIASTVMAFKPLTVIAHTGSGPSEMK